MGRRRQALCALLLAAALTSAATAPAGAAEPRIVGGTAAAEGEFPWAAYLEFLGVLDCTGSLIAPTWILTAGHCGAITEYGGPGWPGPLVRVTLGTNSASSGGEHPAVKRVIPNENYFFSDSQYDVALIELSTPAAEQPIKLAGPGERSLWAAGSMATIAGWGVTSDGGSAPDDLQKARVPIVADPDCARTVSNFDPATMMCAGYLDNGGVDTCQGDSGGPLMVTAPDGSYRLAGSTSYGDGCAQPEHPGVYARVADDALRGWIEAHVPGSVSTGSVAVPAAAPAPPAAKKKKAKKKATRCAKKSYRAKHRKLCAKKSKKKS